MEEEVKKIEAEVKKEWPALISGAGGIATLIGLLVTLGGGVTWLINHHRQNEARQAKMALAQSESEQGDYQAAAQTYAEMLKDDPASKPALDGQLRAAEQQVEDFEVSAPEGQDPAASAGALLDQIMPVLDAGLARAQAPAAKADIQAHIGWAHFLNEKIAEREFGSAAEDNLRAALKQDPKNVYAHAMLGNWLLQTNGDFDEAMRHFDAAVATGRERPMVRTFELGGFEDLDHKGARAALLRVANAMRKDGEPLDQGDKARIRSDCFDSALDDRGEWTESLTAVPPDEEWATYQWLDVNPDADYQHAMRRFVEASLLEMGGDRKGALSKLQALEKDLANQPGSLKNQVDVAVRRLQG